MEVVEVGRLGVDSLRSLNDVLSLTKGYIHFIELIGVVEMRSITDFLTRPTSQPLQKHTWEWWWRDWRFAQTEDLQDQSLCWTYIWVRIHSRRRRYESWHWGSIPVKVSHHGPSLYGDAVRDEASKSRINLVHAKLLLSVDNLENKERERESLCLEIQFPGVVDPIHRERTTPALDVAHAEPGLRNRSL